MNEKIRRWGKRTLIVIVVFIVYLISTIPVGLFLYSLKSEAGLNVFSKTGYHSYMNCLRQELKKTGVMEQE